MTNFNERFQELDDYIASLSPEDRAAQEAKTQDKSEAIFDLIRAGDAVGVAVAMENGLDPTITDENGMTPLHHAAALDTPLIGAVLIRQPSPAPWLRDTFDRLPLDIAESNGFETLIPSLQQVTYPELFRPDHLYGNSPDNAQPLEPPPAPITPDLLQAYEIQCKTIGQVETTPKQWWKHLLTKDHERDR